MFKHRSILDVEVKGRKFTLECSSDSTLSEALQALSQMYNLIEQLVKKSEEKPEEAKDGKSSES